MRSITEAFHDEYYTLYTYIIYMRITEQDIYTYDKQ